MTRENKLSILKSQNYLFLCRSHRSWDWQTSLRSPTRPSKLAGCWAREPLVKCTRPLPLTCAGWGAPPLWQWNSWNVSLYSELKRIEKPAGFFLFSQSQGGWGGRVPGRDRDAQGCGHAPQCRLLPGMLHHQAALPDDHGVRGKGEFGN